MGILDLPKGLISRLPVIGGAIGGSSDQSKDDEKPETEPVAGAPETEPEPEEIDEPDAVDDEPEEPEDEPDEVEEEDEPEPEDEPDESDDEADSEPEDEGKEDISDTTAPSIGPNTVIEKDTPEERLARHEQSDTDAMGLDKRREVVGGSYSASFGKQLTRWALVVLVIAGAAFGAKLLVDDLDKPPAQIEEQAPWSDTDEKPRPLE